MGHLIADVFVDATDTVFRSVDPRVPWKRLCHCWNGSVLSVNIFPTILSLIMLVSAVFNGDENVW